MRKRRLLVASAAAVSTAAALLFGGLTAHGTAPSARSKAAPQTDQLAAGFAAGNTQALVAQLQAGPAQPPAERAWARPARSRLPAAGAGDRRPVLLRRSRTACSHVPCASRPNDLDATSGLASLALSRHRFGLALQLGRRALQISPTTARNYGVVGDAQLELGRYTAGVRGVRHDGAAEAGRLVVRADRVCPRAARLGSTPPAARSCSARDAAADEREPLAWTETQLGKLELSRGRLNAASSHLLAALRTFPGYVYALDAPRPGRARARPPSPGDGARAPCRRDDPAAAVRRPLRRPAAGDRPSARGARPVRDRGRHPAAAGRERGAHRPRDGALRRRPRDPAPRLARARTQGAARAAVDRRRRRARLGARRATASAPKPSSTRSSPFGSARRTPRSSSTAPRSSGASATTRVRGREPPPVSTPTSHCSGARTLRRLAS